MSTRPTTVAQYLAALPDDRRAALTALRQVVNANIDPAFEEGLQYGMLAWFLPHSSYPAGYHCDPSQPVPFASIASQKSHIGIYLMCIYGSDAALEAFREEWLASGKKLDMGKACVRVKKLDDVPLDVLGRAIARISAAQFVAHYEASVPAAAQRAAKFGGLTGAGAARGGGVAAKKVAKKVAKKATKKAAKKAAKKVATKSTRAAATKPSKKKAGTRRSAAR